MRTRTEKKVTTVNELVSLQSQASQKQTGSSTRQISGMTGVTQCSIVLIIHRDLGLKYFNNFTATLATALSANNIPYLKLSDIMTTTAAPNFTTYNSIVTNVTSDGLHLKFETGRLLLQAICQYFNIHCDLSPPRHSREYVAVQKLVTSGCYKCGSAEHTAH